MSFERSMAIGKKGYCLVPGHPQQHKLTVECWGRLRSWLYDNPHGTAAQYEADCSRK